MMYFVCNEYICVYLFIVLQVFDGRKCTTTQEMFDLLCKHLKYATNGGNLRWVKKVFFVQKNSSYFELKHVVLIILGRRFQYLFLFRSAITIFRQRMTGRGQFRVWNSQLLKYAGYRMPDGSIQGDPSSLEFTQVIFCLSWITVFILCKGFDTIQNRCSAVPSKICIQLGWRPKYGLFDMLPLVLQANGEDPDLFEIPLDCILEVAMEHPQWVTITLGSTWH